MDKIERINKDPVPISEKEEDKDKKEEYEFSQGRHVSKYIQEGETTRKVITKEEVYVKKQETVIRNGEVIKNETTEHRYISGNGENENMLVNLREIKEMLDMEVLWKGMKNIKKNMMIGLLSIL